MSPQKRILLIREDRLGDVIMITPMVREIRRTYPDSYIAVMTRSGTKDVFLYNPHINSLIIDDLTEQSYWQVVAKINEGKFTHGLLVYPSERNAFQMFWAGVKKRYMTGFRLFSALTFTRRVSRYKYKNLKHEADYCMDLARRIGVETDNILPEIFVTEEEKKQISKLLLENKVSDDSYKIFLHTGSGNSAPNWSEEKYFLLIKKILKKFPKSKFNLILTSREMSEKFKSDINSLNEKRIKDLSDKINSLRELITYISQADLMISSSTGPAHIADALNIKCIVMHCQRDMSSSRHWGIVNKKSVNLEVPKDFCDKNCSDDKKFCKFEDGMNEDVVLQHIEIN